jgi:peptidoglycan hydrolase-like protein with peptidoglycan-binding domain
LDTSEQPDVSAAEPTKKAEPTSIPRPKPSKQLAWLYGIGSMGTGVKGLQNDLRTAGCGVAPDGVFGPNTQQGVKTFQENEGIDNLVAKLGAVDEITLVALQKSLSAGEQYCGLKENPNPRPGDVFVRPHSLPPCGPPLAPDVACDPSPSPKTSYNPWG